MAHKAAARSLHRLAARQIHAGAEGEHGDGGGLYLRVQGGRATWVFRYTAPSGKRREMGLGVAHRGSLSQAGASLTAARDLAHQSRELLRQGVDPLDARDARRATAQVEAQAKQAAQQRDRWTLARCARDYHERVIEPTRTGKHAAQWIASLENHIPAALWHRAAAEVTAPDLLAALLAVKPHERARNLKGATVAETVRRIRQRLEAVYEDAIFHGRAAANPAAAIRRKMRESAPKRSVKGRLSALAYGEAPALAARLRMMDGTAARALELALLTAARTSEVLHAEWAEFDLAAAVWSLPAERMKAKVPHSVPLSERALQIVKAQAGQDARLVFPSPMSVGRDDGERKPLSNMAMLAALDRLGARGKTTVHGLCRATFSTWANETGAARPDVIEACLAHEDGNRVRAAYNRAGFAAERRALLAAWAEFLARPAADVIDLAARAA